MGDKNRYERQKEVFREHGGILRTSQAIEAGIHPRTLYAMRDTGIAEKLGRGLYRLADLPGLSDPDLVSVAMQAPRGVICLISALAYHGITTQIAHRRFLLTRSPPHDRVRACQA